MDAKWVADRKAEFPEYRKEMLGRLVEFVESERTIAEQMAGEREGDKLMSRLLAWRLRYLDAVLKEKGKVLSGDSDEPLGMLLWFLRLGVLDDEALMTPDEFPHSTLRERFRKALGWAEISPTPFVESGIDFYDKLLDETVGLPLGDYVIISSAFVRPEEDDMVGTQDVVSPLLCRETLPTGSCDFALHKVMPDGSREVVGRFSPEHNHIAVYDAREMERRHPGLVGELRALQQEIIDADQMGFFTVVRDFEGICSFVVDKASPDAYEGDYAVQIVLDGHDGNGNPVRYESALLPPDDNLWDKSQEEQDE